MHLSPNARDVLSVVSIALAAAALGVGAVLGLMFALHVMQQQ
jgi:hypothetical protein